MSKTIHNPDRYMADLRQILAQGRKRLGILLGAGAPVAVTVNPENGEVDVAGKPLIPAIAGLTKQVLESLDNEQYEVVQKISEELGIATPNIEMILSRVRSLAQFVGNHLVYGFNGEKFHDLARSICDKIGVFVSPHLPQGRTPYTDLVSWISGVNRQHPVEIFTTNYDLLMEEAFERSKVPFFDGFSGSFQPFFDPSTTANNDLPPRWARLWKLHGSLGWDLNDQGELIRGKGRSATQLIYPDHLKYAQIQKLPYTAFFERLRKFLLTPDTLLLTCGFSFFDAHISAVIEEALAANPAASIFAFQFGTLAQQEYACKIASRRPNLSVFARDGAVINCISAPWQPGELPSRDWAVIRAGYWGARAKNEDAAFLLGDFKEFSRFFALSQADQIETYPAVPAMGGVN